MPQKQEVLVIGAGLVGTLLAYRLARRGYRVQVIEKRPDLRVASISAGRSINLALAERGRAALRKAGILSRVEPGLVGMRGRMLHQLSGEVNFQPYGQEPEEVIYSVARGELNRILLAAAEEARVEFQFQQTCEDLDLDKGSATIRNMATGVARLQSFHRVLGADGTSSAVRDAILRRAGTPSSLEELGHGYKELTIPAGPAGAFVMEPHALHVWPRGGFMLIALPNCDGSFTVTLFLPHGGDGSENFASLTTPSEIMVFFDRYFPDVVPLIPSLAEEFLHNPVGQLATLKCWPWHDRDRALILGDAAHAIVPFHGQGMNCGFEDCDALIDLLDEYSDDWMRVMPAFAAQRKPNADAIADLALQNYLVMRDQVRDPKFAIRQAVEFELERRFPQQYVSRYAMVMFHQVPYALALQRGALQDAKVRGLVAQADSFNDVDLASVADWVGEELAPLPGLAEWKQRLAP